MRALVLGATGQIGRHLLPLLIQAGDHVEAISRHAQPECTGILWTQADLYSGGDSITSPEVVYSTGPLDGLLAWLARTHSHPTRIVAFSSTSILTKQASLAEEERALAAKLLRAEEALISYCAKRDISWTILRPTLIYGCGMDANLSRIAALAKRWKCVPLPRSATGLRQPVHAEDLAICAWRASSIAKSHCQRYELCGGEVVSYREMVRRIVSAVAPNGRVLIVPSWVFNVAAGLAERLGFMRGLSRAVVDRMATDLVFSDDAAVRDLGWKPRPFHPNASYFPE